MKSALFIVRNKRDKSYVDVYGVSDDSNGYPKFLVRDKTQWRWKSAKHFEPVINRY